MTLEAIQSIVEEVYPKIEKHYGLSKFFPECTPYIEYETSIYGRLSGEEDDGTTGEETPHAEFDRMDNSIVIYYPKMESREHIVQTLVRIPTLSTITILDEKILRYGIPLWKSPIRSCGLQRRRKLY